MEEKLKAFLAVSSGDGYGDGDGCGSGSGDGYGYGDGDGYGDGYGYGHGDGSGDGCGYGDGDGSGHGDGSGDSCGDGISAFCGKPVVRIDGVQTVIYALHGNVAKSAILLDDLTAKPCYVVKGGNQFAHGATLREAQEALEIKLFANMPVQERIASFIAQFKQGAEYPNKQFFDWHNRLTGSCEMGRKTFAQQHNIDVENGSMTPEAFITLTENAYGRDVIQALKKAWEEKYGKVTSHGLAIP